MNRFSILGCNPNETAFLTGTVLVWAILGVAFPTSEKKRHLYVWSALFLTSLSLTLATQSRGAMVALLLAAICAFFMLRRAFKIKNALAMIVIGVGVAVLMPHIARRAASIGDLQEDASITHRLIVWRGAMAIMADNPVSGVGLDELRDVYQKWYQPSDRTEVYLTMISAPFTIAAAFGAIALAAWIAHLATVPLIAVRILDSTNHIYLHRLCTISIFQNTALIFSTMFNVWTIALFLVTHAIFWYLIYKYVLNGETPWFNLLARPASYAMCCALAATSAAFVYARHTETSVTILKHNEFGQPLAFLLKPPRSRETGTSAIYIPQGQMSDQQIRSILRPLADLGVTVLGITEGHDPASWEAVKGEAINNILSSKKPYFITEASTESTLSYERILSKDEQGKVQKYIILTKSPYTYRQLNSRLTKELNGRFDIFEVSEGDEPLLKYFKSMRES